MIVKAQRNKKHRDICIGKVYPVIFKSDSKNNEIRIVDDFGSLSVYEIENFKLYKNKIENYITFDNELVYKTVAYDSFLEDYYEDKKEAVNRLKESVKEIYKNEFSEEELVKLILSDMYSSDEKADFIYAVSSKLSTEYVGTIAKYFINNFDSAIDNSVLICNLLSKFHNQEVYHLFLKYLNEGKTNQKSVENIIINYFDNYYTLK